MHRFCTAIPTWEEHEKRWEEAAAKKLAEIRERKGAMTKRRTVGEWRQRIREMGELAAKRVRATRRQKPIEELTPEQAKRRIRDELRRMYREVPPEVRLERAKRSAAALGLVCPHCGKWLHDEPDNPLP